MVSSSSNSTKKPTGGPGLNVELCDPEKLDEATTLISEGGQKMIEGIAMILEAKEDYSKNPEAKGGKNCAVILSRALKKLKEDPYIALGIGQGSKKGGEDESNVDNSKVEASVIKKHYHKMALKYHPDKNTKTALLFQTCHSAYNLLSDPDKRSAYEYRKKKQAEAMEELRQKSYDKRKGKSPSEYGKKVPSPPSTKPPSENNTSQSYSSTTNSNGNSNFTEEYDEKLKAFNRQFYQEFRQQAKTTAKEKGSSDSGDGSTSSGSGSEKNNENGQSSSRTTFPEQTDGGNPNERPQAPKRPTKLRMTGRTDSSVTLEWASSVGPGTIAYELQWREKNRTAETAWTTAKQLLLGTTVLKKNLNSGSCYEFRVRAASAWGWSGYSESVIVMTLQKGSTKENASSTSGHKRTDTNDSNRGKNRRESSVSNASSTTTTPREKSNRRGTKSHLHRVSRDTVSPWTWKDGDEVDSRRGRTRKASKTKENILEPWTCAVCKRDNDGSLDVCGVCFSAKKYDANHLQNLTEGYNLKRDSRVEEEIEKRRTSTCSNSSRRESTQNNSGYSYVYSSGGRRESKSVAANNGELNQETSQNLDREKNNIKANHGPKNRSESRDRSGSISAQEVDTEEEAWEYTEGDMDLNPPTSNGPPIPEEIETEDEMPGKKKSKSAKDEGTYVEAIYRLNASVTKLHNVRAEPIRSAIVVGYLLADTDVEVVAITGNWVKVKWHQTADYESDDPSTNAQKEGYGWCMIESGNTIYMEQSDKEGSSSLEREEKDMPPSDFHQDASQSQNQYNAQNGDSSGSDSEADQPYWYELTDDNGGVYYFCTITGNSQWEPPLWFDEIDPESGATYYRNSVTEESQWEMPDGFIPVVRAEAYSTPQAEFVKSMLHPTRSFRYSKHQLFEDGKETLF